LQGGEVAIECKISKNVPTTEVKALAAFIEDFVPKKSIIVSQDLAPRRLQVRENTFVDILPWRDFLIRLWAGEII
jgi:predicted AAA+ superfamily ATPase